MNLPTPDQFDVFYKTIHGKADDPNFGAFPWQQRLAKRVCAGNWPRAIALPTAAGKTNCIDIAVFALACRAKNAPRRIFFVVDRRIVVDQACEHAKKLAKVLDRSKEGILRLCADLLRDTSEPGWLQLTSSDRQRILERRWAIQDENDTAKRGRLLRDLKADEREWFGVSPLEVYSLRGGMYRESAWARSPLQPTIIASTVDQVGSRLLFRGYGVSDSMKPIHAGLVGNDSLILLDEAHCAKPFDQTIQAVEKYRTWGEGERRPFRFVSITATPIAELSPEEIERDNKDDRKHAVLGPRISASKPAALVVAKNATGKKWQDRLVETMADETRRLIGAALGTDQNGNSHSVRAIGVIVNRVATARKLAAELKSDDVDVLLLTGRMRPLDRDVILNRLEPLFSGSKRQLDRLVIVVATQCLEVGADLDFHALITECASLDALRQRFGRLNRVAARPSATAVIVIRADQTEDTEEDPVYGASLANTWKWLKSKATDDLFDFGVSAVRGAMNDMSGDVVSGLNAPSSDAPVLFPAHLDCWVQTHPRPHPDPDPALFLHGPKKPGQPDVQVVFRSDLGDDPDKWADIVSLCPPSSSEAVPVPIGVFKKWLAGETFQDETGDVEGEADNTQDDELQTAARSALRWRSPQESEPISDPRDVIPNDVYVIPCSAPDISALGDFPSEIPSDCAEEAFQRSRDKALLRLPGLGLDEEENDFEERLSAAVRSKIAADHADWTDAVIEHLTTERKRTWDRYPEPLKGFVVTGTNRLHQFDPTYLDDSEPAESFRGRQVSLVDHSRGVAQYARRFANRCGLDADLYYQAGLWHDLGKLDPRFQAMLKQSSPRTAVGEPLAKSARSPRTNEEREQARQVHRYPARARHELLSAALVSTRTSDDLLLHLIATHHGSGRPFAEPVSENKAGNSPCRQELFGFKPESCLQDISTWNAELPERFWRVVRKFGWWGAAYREAVFRLADHAQSRKEPERDHEVQEDAIPVWQSKTDRPALHPLPLLGLDGANPLAFLAAIGTLVVCHGLARSENRPAWLAGTVALSWGTDGSPQTPVLHLPSPVPSTKVFVEFLAEQLPRSPDTHSCAWVVRMLGDERRDLVELIREQCRPAGENDRPYLDWVTALAVEQQKAKGKDTAPDAASRLQTVRRDYLLDNIQQVMQLTMADHLERSLFQTWDYADALANQSLHWEPSEDRRHAYQWHMPSGDPTRRKRGGMLGANRLALEAWPLFPSFAEKDRVATRGFKGNRAYDTFFTWPIWRDPLCVDAVASLLALDLLQRDEPSYADFRHYNVSLVFRSQRILVGKTPNLTTARAIG